jgi:hypothetical protein
MSSLIQDLRHGLRTLANRPGLSIAAALSLGLAIAPYLRREPRK